MDKVDSRSAISQAEALRSLLERAMRRSPITFATTAVGYDRRPLYRESFQGMLSQAKMQGLTLREFESSLARSAKWV